MNFPKKFKKELFSTSSDDFNEKAIRLFQYQAQNNEIYKKYLHALNIVAEDIERIEDIPFLPVSLFKHHKVITGANVSEFFFMSSGTSETGRSRHYLHDLDFYRKVSQHIFEQQYGAISNIRLICLLPSYQENPHSSLIFMADNLIKKAMPGSGYVKTSQDTIAIVRESLDEGVQPVLLGVTFALLEMAERFSQDLHGLIMIETGGMKGRRKELIREELHQILCDAFHLDQIHSEYGMCELLSQAYSLREGLFSTPPWMKVLLREVNDPFSLSQKGAGGINIIDLANVDSCAFIETMDIGRYRQGKFEVLGRFDNSDIRGCSQLMV
ncbi:acyl transferase [Cytophagaceae bacterium ABcell3]|nr:acyl transferase [Cytophagaceae bacterium ABcell3]